jgi:hypothetical protein
MKCLKIVLMALLVSITAHKAYGQEKDAPLNALNRVKAQLVQLQRQQSFLSAAHFMLNLIEISESGGVLRQSSNGICNEGPSCHGEFGFTSTHENNLKTAIALDIRSTLQPDGRTLIHVHAILPYETSGFSVYAREFDAVLLLTADGEGAILTLRAGDQEGSAPLAHRVIKFDSPEPNANVYIMGPGYYEQSTCREILGGLEKRVLH